MVQPVTTKKINLAPIAFRQAVRQMRDHAGTTLGTAGLLCIPLAFLGVFSAIRPGWGATLTSYAVGSLIGVLVAYAVTVATGMYADGQDPGVGALLRRTFTSGLFRYIATTILFNLILVLAIGLALIPFFVSVWSIGIQRLLSLRLSEADFLRLFFGFLASLPLMAIAALFVYLKLGLCQPASALERSRPVASVKRSWEVTRGRVWDFFVVLLMTFAVGMAVSIVVSGPAGLVRSPPAPQPNADPLSPAFYRDLFRVPEPLEPAAALVTGVSGYLATLLLTSITAAILANFFLFVRNPPQPVPVEGRRDARMVPLRRPESGDTSSGGPPAAPIPDSSPPDQARPTEAAPPEAGVGGDHPD